MEKEDRKRIIPELRKKSRRDYLVKRQQDKFEDLEQEVQEEDYFFADQKFAPSLATPLFLVSLCNLKLKIFYIFSG